MMMKPLYLFNTETRKKQEILQTGAHFLMYTCGPTVYNFAHIGNLRTYIFEDLLRRTLKYLGYKVKQVMNLTDVDDKTIKGAIEKGISLEEYTNPYIDAFFEDLKTLNIQRAESYPKATDYIPKMIKIIQGLLEKEYAYVGSDGCIYFSIRKFPKYGRLSHLKLEDLKIGASERVFQDEYEKDNASDFVLWKSYDAKRDGSIFWESPFGKGRPGWHIECSAMAMELLGETIDLHCGGVDNIFPHHDNEIAQSECFSGKTFAKFWAHSEHLIVDGKKMSKSLGNFYTLRDLLEKGYDPMVIRYLLLQAHYRTQLNFTFKGLDAAKSSLDRLKDFLFRLEHVEGEGENETKILIENVLEEFKNALRDDLNISVALASLFDFIRETNALCDQKRVGKDEAQDILLALRQMDQVLGFLPFHEDAPPKEILEMLEKREKARHAKNWQLADALRDEIVSKGYIIDDTPSGAYVKKGT